MLFDELRSVGCIPYCDSLSSKDQYTCDKLWHHDSADKYQTDTFYSTIFRPHYKYPYYKELKVRLIYSYMHFLTDGYHANLTYHNACHEDHIRPGSWKTGRYYWFFRQMHLPFLFSILRVWIFQQSVTISAHNEVI